MMTVGLQTSGKYALALPSMKRTIEGLADRLLRKHMLLQFVEQDHPVLQEEIRLVAKSVRELRPQARGLLPLQMAVLYAVSMERAEWSAGQREDDDTVDTGMALHGVEHDLYGLLSTMSGL